MQDNNVLLIIVILAVAAAIGFGVFMLMRYLRGSVRLILPLSSFEHGAVIKGEVALLTRKAIKSNRLIVRITATEVVETRKGDKSDTRHHEVYRSEVLLEEANDYPAAYKKNYSFELKVPEAGKAGLMSTELGQVIASAGQLLANRRSRLQWKLQARLDTPGIDLVHTRRISVH